VAAAAAAVCTPCYCNKALTHCAAAHLFASFFVFFISGSTLCELPAAAADFHGKGFQSSPSAEWGFHFFFYFPPQVE
jgi:hypothetical protein